MVALYDATGGDAWNKNWNWKTDRPLTDWHGVETDRVGRVTELHLAENGLRGSIPPELGNLTKLSLLWLHKNNLGGPIPSELGNLSRLTALGLSDNGLSGPVPSELGNLTNLARLYLERNRLSGSIPSEFDNLTFLTELSLYDNPLYGPIPPGIDELARSKNIRISLMDDRAALEALYDATGGDAWSRKGNWKTDEPLDRWYGVRTDRVGRVTELHLGDNRLRGFIPPELENLTKLVVLSLLDNYIESYSLPLSLAALVACSLTNNDDGVLVCRP